ncbi:MAG: NADH-quinone oxidoreductase subunit NuoN [Sphingomonadales bacterium]|jgi:NADH-quinone oxidoreductase subunit N|nr:NADH-quinone oxidoreductase subunit NuoN [Sphingomonadales bacterium]MBK6493249.1 NADH-quinone oxidoreductase subunit NuoN [Sphingomonadales bacterium]MBK6719885.1 NADH-quinone oxidoreductase subunit NuoN [Sphingomonadales bacterium]MBK8271690.1 NADH-quinone oxidoreductase subunit NuoN [Sphingomonadales bacterium]MBK8861426.1 NADH-quinone oxidoreductase subunit NuoN [Sphingomonadales bacterium]
MFDTASLLLTAPELILSIGATALMLVAAFAGDKATRFVSAAAVALLALAGLSLTGVAGSGGTAFNGLYSADAFGAFAKVLIYLAASVAILIAPRWFEREDRLRAEYPVLILFSAVGMGMMVSATNLLSLYVGLELQSLAAYVLASFMRRDSRSAEAGLKYFVLGALASGILLYGISLLYGFSGTTEYAGVAKALGDGVNLGELFGIVFLLSGIAFKVSAVPFHMWTPDVYEGAPTPVTAFFASAPKVAAIAMLVRVSVSGMGTATHDWQQIIIFMSLASIVLGAAGAIGQTNIKRLLAYSSINNVGFALVGLAAGTEAGVAAIMSYMAIYVVMTLGSFLCVLQMRDQTGAPVETIASLSGLSQTNKGLAAAFAIFMFSLAGIPPLFGFWAKFLVFEAAVKAGLFPLAAIGIAASVIGAFYYLKIIKTMYFDEPETRYARGDSLLEKALIATSAAFIVLGYGLIPALGSASAAAAKALF